MMLGRFGDEMTDLADAIRRRDADRLLAIFTRAKDARDRFVDGIERGAEREGQGRHARD
jgi:prephenate dehydrogenase